MDYLKVSSRRSGEMADALDSKSGVLTGVWVRLPPSAPLAVFIRSAEIRNSDFLCWYPRAFTLSSGSYILRWTWQLGANYMNKNFKNFDCPTKTRILNYNTAAGLTQSDYGYNFKLLCYHYHDVYLPTAPMIKPSKISNPSNIIVTGDSGSDNDNYAISINRRGWTNHINGSTYETANFWLDPRHAQSTNILFLGGNVSARKVQAVDDDASNWGY